MNLVDVEGFGSTLIRRAQAHFGRDLDDILRTDPYRLTELQAVGFLLADRAALKFGMSRRDPKRQSAAANYVLSEAENDGHTALPIPQFGAKMHECLGEPLQNVEVGNDVVEIDGLISRARTYESERYAADVVGRMLRESPPAGQVVEDGLAEDQRAALAVIQRTNIFCLLGSPGTGKTTLIKSILRSNDGQEIALCAPTGKAAKRIEESTGVPAKTIHRLLEAGFDDRSRKFRFRRDGSNPIDSGIVVCDEASMLDIRLFASLLGALTPDCRLILIGDTNQLPSVGPGRVLANLCDSSAVPNVELTQLKRFDPDLLIAKNCGRIRQGQMPEIANAAAKDFFFIEKNTEEAVAKEVIDLHVSRLSKKYDVDPNRDVITLTALREKGALSTRALNCELKLQLNPPKITQSFQPGDRVIQLANDYSLEVFNGDIGTIVRRDSHGNLTVKFDTPDRLVTEDRDSDAQLSLAHAWALTVHKSQGSEWPWVIIPIHESQGGMVPTRPWIYTAISRAKQGCVIVGSRRALEATVMRTRDERRWTRLTEMLKNG